MNRESQGQGHAEGAGRDTCAANIVVVRRIFEAVETRGDPKDFARDGQGLSAAVLGPRGSICSNKTQEEGWSRQS